MGSVSIKANTVFRIRLGGLKSTVSDIVNRIKGARTGHLKTFIPIIEALRL